MKFLFIFLCILLLISIAFFVIFPIIKRREISTNFKSLCSRKIERISLTNNFRFIDELKYVTYDNKLDKINHVIFADKYVYIITDFALLGNLSGDVNNSSWIYKNYKSKKTQYFDNIFDILQKNVEEFAVILNIPSDLIMSIAIIPDECNLRLTRVEKDNLLIARYSSVYSMINVSENRDVKPLNQTDIVQYYDLLRNKYEKDK